MVTFSLYAGWSDTQFVVGFHAVEFEPDLPDLSFPDTVLPGRNVPVAFGANRPTYLVDVLLRIASWKPFSIWLI